MESLNGFDIWLNEEFLGNTLRVYFTAFGIGLAVIVLMRALQWLVLMRIRRFSPHTATHVDDAFIVFTKSFHSMFYAVVALYVTMKVISIPDLANTIIDFLFVAYVYMQTVVGLHAGIEHYVNSFNGHHRSRAVARAIANVVKIILSVTGLFLVMYYAGVDPVRLVASLGLLGLAGTLAFKGFFVDLFNSFTILTDRPFDVGDSITTPDFSGIVERIGIRSTRIRTPRGEELSVPNSQIAASRIHNMSRIRRRREIFTVGVVGETSLEMLKRLSALLRVAVGEVDNVEVQFVRLSNLGESSVEFEIAFDVTPPVWAVFALAAEEVRLATLKCLGDNKVKTAYPTQRIMIA